MESLGTRSDLGLTVLAAHVAISVKLDVVMHDELLSALSGPPGLILVAGSTGNGKTTAIEAVLGDRRCPPRVVFLGDIRGDVEDAFRAVQLARSLVVVAVLRIRRAAGSFGRLTAMGVAAHDLAEVVRSVFTTRLLRPAASAPILLHEQLVVTNAIRELVLAGVGEDALHRQAIADGMRSLRQASLDHVRAGRLTPALAESTPDD